MIEILLLYVILLGDGEDGGECGGWLPVGANACEMDCIHQRPPNLIAVVRSVNAIIDLAY